MKSGCARSTRSATRTASRSFAALRDTTLAASDVAHVIGRNRTATSQHLRKLRELGAIVAERKGNVVRYTLSSDISGSIIEEAASVFDRLQPGTEPAAG